MKKQQGGKIDLSIIILVFNAREYLRECVQSVKQSNTKGFMWEIVLVDNVSTDGSRELVEEIIKREKNIHAVFNVQNFGFSKGNNQGVKQAKGKYLLFLNPDTVLSKNALKTAYEYIEKHGDVGVVGARLHLPNGETDSPAHRGFPTPWNAICQFTGLRTLFPHSRLFSGYTIGWLIKRKEPHEVDSISGAFFFIRKKIGERLQWWDEDYFMYGEDIDFCYRVKAQGWKIVFLPQAEVLHYGGVSAGIRKHIRKTSLASQETRVRSTRASTQAMRIFYQKHYKHIYPQFLTEAVLRGISTLEILRLWRIR